VAREGGLPLGWVIMYGKDGSENLVGPITGTSTLASAPALVASPRALLTNSPTPLAAGVTPPQKQSSFAQSKVPSLAGAAMPVGSFPLLPPTTVSSGGLTARSTAKATATAGAAKAALPSEAVKAAETAAREAVAAKAAELKAEVQAKAAAADPVRRLMPRMMSSSTSKSAGSAEGPSPTTPGRASTPNTPGRGLPSARSSPGTPSRSGRSPFSAKSGSPGR
jgi:hypothetical protein